VQVSTDGLAAHVGARFLLSDKQLKVWSLVSAASLARLQEEFPEFQPSGRNLAKLAGGIIVPTRGRMYVHPNMHEFVMQIDEFEVRRTHQTQRKETRRRKDSSEARRGDDTQRLSRLPAASCGWSVSQYKGGAGNNEFAHPIFHTQGEQG